MSPRHNFRRAPILRVGSKERRTRDGITFDSVAEAKRYDELRLAQLAGQVVMFLRQPKFDLGGGTTYSADFLVFWHNDTVTVEDVKPANGGHPKTIAAFNRSRKQVESLYPITITEVRK